MCCSVWHLWQLASPASSPWTVTLPLLQPGVLLLMLVCFCCCGVLAVTRHAKPGLCCSCCSINGLQKLRNWIFSSLRFLCFLFYLVEICVAVQPSSQFAAAYSKGINKLNYWEPVMEDSLDIIAKLPAIAALIYTNVYKGGNTIQADSKLDWAANLSHMMGACFAQYALHMSLDCCLCPWSCVWPDCVQSVF